MANSAETNAGRPEDPEHVELTDTSRTSMLACHPIREREYILPTPMMERVYEVVRDRVWTRRTGVVFYSMPRMGKTRCAMAIKDHLCAEFPNAYVTLLSARRANRPTDGHMFRLILEAENHSLSGRSNADALFNNVKADIRVKLVGAGGHQYVLLIDELQLLNDTDLQQLVCLHNSLELANIKMTTISFAQPEILHRRSALMATNDRQIIARFLSEPLRFEGCSQAAELATLLRAYDVASEYPENSGWSYTRFFFPIAFQQGFRLETYASQIWRELSRASGLGSNGVVPMEHICLTIEYLLLALRKQDYANFVIVDVDIANAVASSNLQNFSTLMDGGSGS